MAIDREAIRLAIVAVMMFLSGLLIGHGSGQFGGTQKLDHVIRLELEIKHTDGPAIEIPPEPPDPPPAPADRRVPNPRHFSGNERPLAAI